MGTLRRIRLGLVGVLSLAAGLSAPPTSLPAAAETITVTWSVQHRVLGDGRSYYVLRPACAPVDAPGCVDFLGRPRSVVVWFHGAGGAEDVDTATHWLTALHNWGTDTLFVFAVSENGSQVFDAGNCCTTAPVDDVGYLARAVDDVAAHWPVDRGRIGVAGVSNGGMMAERVACERPDLVVAATSVSGTFGGPCDVGRTAIAQWHGALDQLVPLNGGSSWGRGTEWTFPPAASLGQRMASGSTFELRVRPGAGHALPWVDYRASVKWLLRVVARG